MTEFRATQMKERERNSTTEFLIVDNPTRSGEFLMVDETQVKEPPIKPIPEGNSALETVVRDSFGQVNPILSSGEWSEKELVQARGKVPLLERLFGFLYT